VSARTKASDFPLLGTGAHAVYRLGPGLLLVFKPRGHSEEPHAHAYRQTLRILRGALRVRTERTTRIIGPSSAPLTIVAGRRHATDALMDTWLVAQSPRR
jgi:quercetin dioxygenase-like cupin family protein